MENKRKVRRTIIDRIKNDYRKQVEVSIIICLVFLITIFYSFQKFEITGIIEGDLPDGPIIVVPPITTGEKTPPKPASPKIPIESNLEEDDLPESDSIEEFNFNNLKLVIPKKDFADEDPDIIFTKVEIPPKLIKGYPLEYPGLAVKSKLEGEVVLKLLIGKDGQVEKVDVVKSIPLLDEAAIKSAINYKYTPAMQRDKKVRVWIRIPVVFKLK